MRVVEIWPLVVAWRAVQPYVPLLRESRVSDDDYRLPTSFEFRGPGIGKLDGNLSDGPIGRGRVLMIVHALTWCRILRLRCLSIVAVGASVTFAASGSAQASSGPIIWPYSVTPVTSGPGTGGTVRKWNINWNSRRGARAAAGVQLCACNSGPSGSTTASPLTPRRRTWHASMWD